MHLFLTKTSKHFQLHYQDIKPFAFMKQLKAEQILVDYFQTEDPLLETLLMIRWNKYKEENETYKLPIEEAISFRSLCKELTIIAESELY